jgi:hypothetical protein
MILAGLAFVFVATGFPHARPFELVVQGAGAFLFFGWIAWMGAIYGYHRRVEDERDGQPPTRFDL